MDQRAVAAMPLDGVLVLDKPAGMSSAAAVDRVKRALRADRAGHGGTLDPIATGVLPICLGAATKLAQYLLADAKAYEAEGVLGVATDTLDRTGRVVAERPPCTDEAALRAALARRLGAQDQVPPAFSAIKQGGVRMYHRARAGEEVQLQPRRIRIDRLELLAFAPPRFRVAVACSKGTYIRSLVADLGADVGCGAHLAELRRTRSGRFRIEDAIELHALEAEAARDPEAIAARLVPPAAATGLPRVVVAAALIGPIRAGLQLDVAALGPGLAAALAEAAEAAAAEAPEPAEPASGEGRAGEACEAGERGPGAAPEPPRFQLVDEAGRLLAIAHTRGGRVVYDRVLGPAAGAPGA